MKHPALVPVKSSNLQSVGYGPGGLFVRFSGGALYSYPDAPKSVYDKLVGAESPGKVFQAEVRGKYAHLAHDDA